MKKSLLLISLLSFATNFSQTDENTDGEKQSNGYNRWTIEVNAGQSRGLNPFSEGYSSSDASKILGKFTFNNFGIGARYMMNPKFGVKADLNYDIFKNFDNSPKKFEVEQYRLGIQGVINASRLLGIEENLKRFGLLIHGGVNILAMSPKLDTGKDITLVNTPGAEFNVQDSNAGNTEYNGGLIFGISPQYRITNKLAISFDLSTISNYRQHFAWDGHYAQENNNLSGRMINYNFGLNYSLGSSDFHGDWALIEDKKLQEITELDNRINDLETLMNDTDKDGVPDYLDVENNSITGVAVDTKGRMIDVNKNGVPDELEKLVTMTTSKDGVDGVSGETKTANAINAQMIEKLINEGYVTAYFEFNQTDPTDASTEGIDFILTYMRNHPESTIEILGHADEVGNSEYNNKLANNRSANVKKVLIDAGINASRLVVIGKGEDKSVNPNSSQARRLVRKVSFKIKK
ncbi:OmpA family protein [Flavobacterium sp.]|jgi:OOP family OmpA-OmpF porin|uniref:OmpA family protein n=1 Tax=Flavobacterium sp. TaxID=239 RepID=UPI0037BE2820